MYRIHFQNIHTFTYQKALLHTLLILVFETVESHQRILKLNKSPGYDEITFNVIKKCFNELRQEY